MSYLLSYRSKSLLLAILAFAASDAGQAQQSSLPATNSTAVRFLTEDSNVSDYWPCFSPDGKTILFSRTFDGGKTWTFFAVPAEGGTAHEFARNQIPSGVSATRANWSARANLVAFTGTSADGKSGVWVMNADGTNPHALAIAGLSDQVFYPSWYPDGQLMAVMDANDRTVKRIDQKQGSATVLTKYKQVLAGMPSVSPDGKLIAFAGQSNAGQSYDQTKNVIWLLNDAGALHTLETPPSQGRAPTWSPDGKWVTFESDRGSSRGRYAIFMTRRDGGGLTQLTNYELNSNHPVWSPDGRKMVFSALKTGSNNASIAIIDIPKIR